jgi:hypothetical protein
VLSNYPLPAPPACLPACLPAHPQNESWVSLSKAGKLAVAEQGGRVIWRTTTATLGKKSTVNR